MIKKVLQTIKSRINKNEFTVICIFSVMLVCNFFVFNQFDILLNNPGEFGVIISEIIFAYTWRCFLVLFLFFIGFTALCCYSKKGFKYTVAASLGFALACYFQVLFLNDERLLTVDGSMGYADPWDYILNTSIFLLVASVPTIFLVRNNKLFAKQNNISSNQQKSFSKLVIAVSLIVLGMQTIGLFSVAVTAPRVAKNDSLYYFSVDKQLGLSKNENIIVFIIDKMDTIYSDEVFEDPEYEDIFSGFTYYTNNLSEYPNTFPSVLSMLSGKKYNKQTKGQIDYTREAWQEEVLFDALRNKNYIVNGLPNGRVSYYDVADLYYDDGVQKFNNMAKLDKGNRTINQWNFFKTITAVAQTRQSPFVLKTLAISDPDPINYYIDIKNTPDFFPNWNSSHTDLMFYDKLMSLGLSADEEKNVLSFVHLQGSHGPNIYDEDLIARGHSTTPVAQTRGVFKILDEYFEQLKALSKFDDATIIVTADHGVFNETGRLTGITKPSMSALLIKESGNSDSISLKKDHDSQLSHNNFQATILETIGAHDIKDSLDGDAALSYTDIVNYGGTPRAGAERQAGVQTRYFYLVRWTNLSSCSYFCSYEITGDARKIQNWKKLK